LNGSNLQIYDSSTFVYKLKLIHKTCAFFLDIFVKVEDNFLFNSYGFDYSIMP